MRKKPPVPVPIPTRATPLHEEIARRAYEIWQGEGQPEGRDTEHWLTAERQLLGADAEVAPTGAGSVRARPLSDALSGGTRERPPGTPELVTNTSR